MNKDIVKVGFAVLAAVTTYSFADMVISAEENDTQPVVAIDVSSTNEIETDASLDVDTSDKSEKPSVELVNGWTKDYTQAGNIPRWNGFWDVSWNIEKERNSRTGEVVINLLNKKINEFRYQWETIRGKRKQGMISEDEYTVEIL